MNEEQFWQLVSTLNRIAEALENIGDGVHLAANQGTVTMQANELISLTKPMKGEVAP